MTAVLEVDAVSVAPEPERIHRIVEIVRKRGCPRLEDASNYHAGLPRDQAEAAARGYHKIYLDECCLGWACNTSCRKDHARPEGLDDVLDDMEWSPS